MSNIFKNTIQKGNFRSIVFKEGGVWYAVALEFNLIIDANDPETAFFSLLQLAKDYIDVVKENNLRPFALNQVPQKEYLDLWYKLNKNEKIPSPYQEVYQYGVNSISKSR